LQQKQRKKKEKTMKRGKNIQLLGHSRRNHKYRQQVNVHLLSRTVGWGARRKKLNNETGSISKSAEIPTEKNIARKKGPARG